MKQRNGSNAAPERSTAPGLALAALAATALMAAAGSAQAQPAWPSKPVRMIVNFGAGGSADTMARLVAPSMQEAFGQPIVIEIRAGATGSIGADFVARQPPDGYTLLLTSGAFSMAPALTTKLPYDIFRDFTPVIGTSNAPQVLVVHPSVPVKTVKELVAFARARPGQLGWATAGIGSTGHLAGEYFSSLVGIKLNHVPYKSNPAADMDVIGGHVPIMFDQLSTAAQHIKAGKVRALAITSPKRHPLLPDVPNMV
ncbi:MAG: tripartite tricarboxylate transporter substrate binding protein, partial [Rhodocyclaceae bacterium]|nr:tripartite tricarboxylate transporter substrate binding protein [Rhodocyclaceae bacterium]